ncbi:MAG: hypothetical protein LBQ28_04410 [Prevotellaceae bacterium]|jgi:hypothetical protein|nr:hypothetical protein [Prevotellaceae bacterium]
MVIRKDHAQISSLTSYLVADAYFSPKGFVDKIRTMNLHLVFNLRDDADLLYLSAKASTGKRGRPFKYDGKVNPGNPPNSRKSQKYSKELLAFGTLAA